MCTSPLSEKTSLRCSLLYNSCTGAASSQFTFISHSSISMQEISQICILKYSSGCSNHALRIQGNQGTQRQSERHSSSELLSVALLREPHFPHFEATRVCCHTEPTQCGWSRAEAARHCSAMQENLRHFCRHTCGDEPMFTRQQCILDAQEDIS